MALEAAGCDLERIAGRSTRAEIREPMEGKSSHLAGARRRPQNDTAEGHSRSSEHTRTGFREGSKAAQVCTWLSRPEGATVLEIPAATGWQAHSVRGFLSGSLRRQGRKLGSLRRNGERAYRLPG